MGQSEHGYVSTSLHVLSRGPSSHLTLFHAHNPVPGRVRVTAAWCCLRAAMPISWILHDFPALGLLGVAVWGLGGFFSRYLCVQALFISFKETEA